MCSRAHRWPPPSSRENAGDHPVAWRSTIVDQSAYADLSCMPPQPATPLALWHVSRVKNPYSSWPSSSSMPGRATKAAHFAFTRPDPEEAESNQDGPGRPRTHVQNFTNSSAATESTPQRRERSQETKHHSGATATTSPAPPRDTKIAEPEDRQDTPPHRSPTPPRRKPS